MILNESIEVRIINHNINHYKELGYNVKYNDKIYVKSHELSSGSHCIVECKCNNCDNTTNIKYQDYLKVINKNNNKYICNSCRKINFSNLNITKRDIMIENRKKSLNEKYNVDNIFQLEDVKNKIKETCKAKYGCEHYRQNEFNKEIEKQKRIRIGSQIPDHDLSSFQIYKKRVLYYTRKNKNRLFNEWNGLDYYDNEFIKENYKLHFNDNLYPNIDHKISIKNGFIYNTNPDIIGGYDNLCITKRINNLSKGSLYSFPKIKINK
jgi:hypothetical protein